MKDRAKGSKPKLLGMVRFHGGDLIDIRIAPIGYEARPPRSKN